MSTGWQHGSIDVARATLTEPGAVIVRLDRDGPSVVSRLYPAHCYKDTKQLRRVAISRATRLFNADGEGWNYYVVIRYRRGHYVVWTGMHSILIEEVPT